MKKIIILFMCTPLFLLYLLGCEKKTSITSIKQDIEAQQDWAMAEEWDYCKNNKNGITLTLSDLQGALRIYEIETNNQASISFDITAKVEGTFEFLLIQNNKIQNLLKNKNHYTGTIQSGITYLIIVSSELNGDISIENVNIDTQNNYTLSIANDFNQKY